VWELLSRGTVPYAGMCNTEVFEFVETGGRLTCPVDCPELVYRQLMLLCWQSEPVQRPGFVDICQLLPTIIQQVHMMMEHTYCNVTITDID
jgi:hypothetical protein